MFDTMTFTKIVGGFCGAFLIFLLGGWAADLIYTSGEGGHGEGEQAYLIEVPEGGAGAQPADAGPPFEELLASADVAAGETAFRACSSCHKVEEGVNGTGPSLYGVVGRPVDAVPGFNYSGALEQVVDVWTPEHINDFITNPRGYAPGTAMTYNGMRDPQDRANLIAWLDSLDG